MFNSTYFTIRHNTFTFWRESSSEVLEHYCYNDVKIRDEVDKYRSILSIVSGGELLRNYGSFVDHLRTDYCGILRTTLVIFINFLAEK